MDIAHATSTIQALIDPHEDFAVIAEGFGFTEGPVWQPSGGRLSFSDLHRDARWSWTAENGLCVVAQPSFKVNGATLDRDGHILLCEHASSSVVRMLAPAVREAVAFNFEGTYLNSPNDVIVRSDGSVWFTDSNYGRWDHLVGVARPFELGFQGVYRVPAGGGPCALVVERAEFQQPNGLCFSPDESPLYVSDLDNVKKFTIHDDGTLSAATILHHGMGSSDENYRGSPDGMRCDELGNIWVAARDGIWVIDPAGQLLGIIETPEICANLTWGGVDGRTLYTSTSTTVRAVRTRVRPAVWPLPGGAR